MVPIKCKSHHVTPLFEILQCLPIPLVVKDKLFTMIFRTLNELNTHCLSDAICYHPLPTLLHLRWTPWHLSACQACHQDFPGGSVVKNPPANTGDMGLIPGSGRSPGEGNGNPLQYLCLESPMDGGAWQATVHGVAKSRTQLSAFHFSYFIYSVFASLRCTAQ